MTASMLVAQSSMVHPSKMYFGDKFRGKFGRNFGDEGDKFR